MEENITKNLQEEIFSSISNLKTSKSVENLKNLFKNLSQIGSKVLDEKQIPNNMSKDLIFFLTNNLIDTKIQIDIFKLYIDSFFSLSNEIKKIDDSKNLMFLERILDRKCSIYEKAIETKDYNLLLKSYFDKYFPKKEMTYEPGKIVDVLISEKHLDRVMISSWIQLPIKRFENNIVYLSYKESDKEEEKEIKDLYLIREKNTFTKEEEILWRKTIKIGDKVDILDKKLNWIGANVLNIIADKLVLLPFGYKKDDFIIIDINSSLVRPFGTFSFKCGPNEEQFIPTLKLNPACTPFSYCLPSPKYEEKDINYLIPEGKIFSLLYFDILNYFLNSLMKSKILDGKNDDYSFEFLKMITIFIAQGFDYIHNSFNNFLYNEKLFPLLKESLFKISLDKKKNLEKETITKLFDIIFYGIDLKCYEFHGIKIILELTLQFGLNCFNENEKLQKRLVGLDSIYTGLNTYYLFFRKNGKIDDYDIMIHNFLLNETDNKKNILELIFNKNSNSIHEQLVLQGKTIILKLFNLNIFKDNDINKLLNIFISSEEETDIYKQLYLILNETIKDFNHNQIKEIFNIISKNNIQKKENKYVNLLFNAIKDMKNQDDNKKLINDVLDFIYNLILNNPENSKELYQKFSSTINSLKSEELIIHLSKKYLEKIINELLNKNDLNETAFLFKFIKNFIEYISNDQIKEKLRSKFLEILAKNENHKKILEQVFNDKEKTSFKNISKEKFAYFMNILESLTYIVVFINKNIFLDADTMIKFFDIFLYIRENYNEKYIFNNSIVALKSSKLLDKEKFSEKFFKKLQEFISNINEKNELYYLNSYDTLYNLANDFYKEANNIIIGNERHTNEYASIDEKCYIKINPMDNKYFDILFNLLIKNYDKNLIDQFFYLFSLRLFSPEERYKIWENIFKKIFELNDNNIDYKAILYMINVIIEKSEKYGTAGVISHLREKIKKFPLKIKILTKNLNDFIGEIPKEIIIDKNIYSSSTIYDLKKLIQKKLSIDPIFIDFLLPNTFISAKNGETLYSFLNLERFDNIGKNSEFNKEIKKVQELRMNYSYDFIYMPRYNILDEKNPENFDTKTINVIFNIFKNITYTTEKLTYELYKDFLKNFYFYKEADESLKKKFNSFDINGKGFLTFDEFLKLFKKDIENDKDNNKIFRLFNSFGYRNDLEPYNKPLDELCPCFYIENTKAEFMPRYFIGKNMDYINKIFEIGAKNDKLKEESNNLIDELTSIINIKDLIFDENKDIKKIDELLMNKNIEMKTYMFDIILSEFIQNKKYKDKDEDNNIIDLFIEKYLIKLIDNLDDYTNEIKNEINNNIITEEQKKLDYNNYCSYYNIIIHIILFSLLKLINKSEFHQIIFDMSKGKDFKNMERILHVISEFDISFKSKEIIIKINYQKLENIIISYLISISNKTKTSEEYTETSLIILLIIFMLLEKNIPEINKEKNIIYDNYINNITNICLIPVYDYQKLLEKYNSYIIFIKKSDEKFISSIKEEISKEILNWDKYNTFYFSNAKIFIFKIFELLINILLVDEENSENKNTIKNNDNFLFDIMEKIINIIKNEEIHLNEELVANYLKSLCLIISKLKEINNEIIYNYDLSNFLSILINDFLIISPLEKNKEFYSNYNDIDYISYLFDLLTKIISINPIKYIFQFFAHEKIKNLISIYLTKLPDDKRNYVPKEESLSTNNYLGIKNLSSICYMNSVMQTLYMLPLFRKSILSLKINFEEFKKIESKEDFDDLLFQLQRMFYYLTFSQKSYYNPKNFVFSFKDNSGNPTNPSLQCDAEEFLTKFVDKLEKILSNSPYKFLCHNILGGKTLQQIICTNPECNNISEKTDSIVYLSLDIKDNDRLKKCLDKYIIKEKIEDYHCEKCDQKGIHTKQVLIKNLPNFLIIHLQRITFNYHTFNMVKINDKVSFEKELNIKEYTINYNNGEIDNQKYDYDLIGIIVHSGTAQAGHYYSFIKSQDKNNENIWYKFNDMTVTQTFFENIMKDLNQYSKHAIYAPSPYMLIYAKKIKNPILINVEEINNMNIINKLKEENNNFIEDNYIKYEVYQDENEAIEKNKNEEKINKKIILKNIKSFVNIISYEEGLNYINTIYDNYDDENIIFKSLILQENKKFCNDKKIYSKSFSKFIKDITFQIKTEIKNNNTLVNNYEPIIKIINDYLFEIFKFSDYKYDLIDIINNICFILKSIPKFVSDIIKEFIEPKKEIIYKEYFLTNNKGIGEVFSFYFGKILSLSINDNIENEISMKIINYYLDKMPVELSKDWTRMEFYNNFIYVLIDNSDKIKELFLSNHIISKIIDFILGKESPLYEQKNDERFDNKNIEGNLNQLVKSILLLYKYYLNQKDTNKKIIIPKEEIELLEYIPFYEKITKNINNNEDSIIELISIKLDSFKNKDYLDKSFLDFTIKVITPASKTIKGLELCLNLIERIINAFEQENEKDLELNKKKVLQIILGIPLFFKTDEPGAKIYYLCGLDDRYFGILNNFSYKEFLSYPYVNTLYKYILKYDYLYQYLSSNPAYNSTNYSFLDYIIKALWEIDKESEEKNINKEEKEEFIKLSEEIYKKYNINYESIINNEIIKPFIYFDAFSVNYIEIQKMKNMDFSLKEKFNSYSHDINFYYYRLYFSLDENQKQSSSSLIHKISLQHEIPKNQKYFFTEAITLRTREDCELEISFEPYIYNSMKIRAKVGQNYYILMKKPDKLYPPYIEPNDYETNIDFSKLKFKFKNDEYYMMEDGNNENGFVINCPVCGTPNTISNNNQFLQCIACTSELL